MHLREVRKHGAEDHVEWFARFRRGDAVKSVARTLPELEEILPECIALSLQRIELVNG